MSLISISFTRWYSNWLGSSIFPSSRNWLIETYFVEEIITCLVFEHVDMCADVVATDLWGFGCDCFVLEHRLDSLLFISAERQD